jgi:hypothetical protein
VRALSSSPTLQRSPVATIGKGLRNSVSLSGDGMLTVGVTASSLRRANSGDGLRGVPVQGLFLGTSADSHHGGRRRYGSPSLARKHAARVLEQEEEEFAPAPHWAASVF